MMNKLLLSCSLMLCFVFSAQAQSLLTGIVSNTAGESLPGALVELLDMDKSTTTDAYGFFKIRGLAHGTHQIKVSYIGYKTYEESFEMNENTSLEIVIIEDIAVLQTVEVNSLRVEEEAPFSFVNIDKETLRKNNLGQDIPYLLRNTPSVVATSDAGAGVGYTGIRVRGSDATRTNVVINDIPLNDSESQGTFWVNLPDLASSTNSIQIQRGVGASTNGAGAFGATVNVDTKGYDADPFVELSNTYGSFNTRKHTLNLNSGLLKNKMVLEGRLSLINSDGYIDRASSDLKSAYLSAGYFLDNFSIQGVAMLGKEITYQSWYGSPESLVNGDNAALGAHYNNNVGSLYNTVEDSINLFSSGRRFNYYQYGNQVDDYSQNHYQVHINNQLQNGVSTQVAFHYTQGKGFFEEFKFNEDFEDYGLSNPILSGDTITSSNLVRRRWLDNDFYGAVASLSFDNKFIDLKMGGAFHRYEGDHFGRIIETDIGEVDFIGANYYFGESIKDDANIYAQVGYDITKSFNAFLDLQFRTIAYTTSGTDNDLVNYDIDENFSFFNPKLGLTYKLEKNQLLYTSLGVANKEPSRSDFIDALDNAKPEHETLYNLELGYKKLAGDFTINTNLYYMLYENQLIPTGELNDVGSAVRTNVADSYRVGLEIDGVYKFSDKFYIGANAAFSQNKIENFEEIIYDYTNGFEIITNIFTDTDIAFSPNIVAGLQLVAAPIKDFEIGLYPKFVGKQFLDNTSNDAKSLDSYLVTDLLGRYDIRTDKLKELSLSLKVNNLFNALYSANGYTYSYVFGDLITENFLYPQAGINFLAGLTIKF